MIDIESTWDEWLGSLTLNGVDPRRWDLQQLLAAYEVTLKRSAKDEAEWERMRTRLYAEPVEVKRERLARERSQVPSSERPRVGMTLDAVEALLASAAAADARYGSR